MSHDDFDADKGISHDHEHEPQHEHEVEEALEEALELDTQSQIFLEMRRQNLDLLRSPPRSPATPARMDRSSRAT